MCSGTNQDDRSKHTVWRLLLVWNSTGNFKHKTYRHLELKVVQQTNKISAFGSQKKLKQKKS